MSCKHVVQSSKITRRETASQVSTGLVVDDDVVLRRHVIRNVEVNDEPQQLIEQSQVDLLVQLLQLGLHEDVALAVGRLPNLLQVVNSLTPLVDEEWRRFRIGRLDPRREQCALVRLVTEVLVEVGVGDLLQRLDVVIGDQVAVQVHELDADFLERSLSQQVTLDPRQCFVRVVVGLFDQPELLALTLVQARLDGVGFLESLEGENEQLRVVLVRQRRERDGSKPPRLEPVDGGRVDRHRFFGTDVRPVLPESSGEKRKEKEMMMMMSSHNDHDLPLGSHY